MTINCGMTRIRFQLATEVVDIDAQLLGVLSGVIPPDPLQKLAVREHLPGLTRQHPQQVEFGRREMDLLPTAKDEISVRDRWSRLRR